MPTISLRMTDEQMEQLRAWAHEGHRSLQRELIYRLFTTLPWTEAAREQNNVERIQEKQKRLAAEALMADSPDVRESGAAGVGASSVQPSAAKSPRVTAPDPHFKPDPKGGR